MAAPATAQPAPSPGARDSPARGVTVAWLPGDGVGPEVAACAEAVLHAAARNCRPRIERALIGGAAIDRHGNPLPDATLELARGADAVWKGPVGGPRWDHLRGPARCEAGLLRLRKELAVYANLRPAALSPALAWSSPLRPEVTQAGVDLLIVRELTGGTYFAEPKFRDGDRAVDTTAYSRAEVERLARVGFEAARRRRRHVTSVDKANVLETSRLWRDVVTDVAKDYPDVELRHELVDACAMLLITHPSRFDVVITDNLFGDILSDEAGVLAGSNGVLGSASLGDPGSAGLFEPVHGSAPDIAGQDRCNPLGAILSVAMLLRYGLGDDAAGGAVEAAVDDVLAAGLRTADIAPAGHRPVGTSAMGRAVEEAVGARVRATR